MTTQYATYPAERAVPPPKPSLNGGLYTGQPFAPGAPWANVPVEPDAGYMVHYNLRSANPPPGALYQYPGSIRPGNSHQTMPGIVKLPHRRYDAYCIADTETSAMTHIAAGQNNGRFSKYFYLG